MNYREFIKAKVKLAEQFGFDVADHEVNPILKPHQRDMVRWLCKMGRAACFAAFGLGKSVIQLEAVRLTLERAGGMGLIVIPLGVRQEFLRDADMLGIPVKFIRRIEDASDDDVKGTIYLTNYETVRDGKLDPRAFTVASLDEASILRGFGGSGGNRLMTPEELETLDHDVMFRWFRDYHLDNLYDYEHHVRIGETMDGYGRLPVTFMLFQPPSWMDDVWTDVARMRTLNMLQSAKGKEQHLCPMQFDIADRIIERFSNPGDTVFDPFSGIGSVGYRAILKGRKFAGTELSTRYFMDACHYLQAAENETSMPDLFGTLAHQREEMKEAA